MSLRKNIFILFLVFSKSIMSHPPSRSAGAGIRFFFGPSYGFYTINKNHSQNASSRMSLVAGFRKEVMIGNDHKTFFLFGADYFFHGLNFQSYYFKPDSLQLYDKKFAYSYALNMHEVSLPLQMKFSFTRENNSVFSPYLLIGYHLRYLLHANINVTQNGNRVVKDALPMKFKNPLILDQLNSAISISAGWQKNSVNKSSASFFAELNYRYGFSPYYFQTNYSASSLFINSSHLSLLLGVKF
jgi:hypothetical protein